MHSNQTGINDIINDNFYILANTAAIDSLITVHIYIYMINYDK